MAVWAVLPGLFQHLSGAAELLGVPGGDDPGGKYG